MSFLVLRSLERWSSLTHCEYRIDELLIQAIFQQHFSTLGFDKRGDDSPDDVQMRILIVEALAEAKKAR